MCCVLFAVVDVAEGGQAPAQPVRTQTSAQRPAASKAASNPSGDDPAWSADLSINFNRSASATWWQVMPSVTRDLDDRWTIEFGAPVYFVSGVLSEDGLSHAGIGDVYASLSADLSGDVVTFSTTASGSLATGNVSKGLGAGQFTWEWSNHLARQIDRVTPYVDAGLSNALDYTASISRNFVVGRPGAASATSGTLFNAEVGTEVSLTDDVSVSGSAYITRGSGSQTTRSGPPRPGALRVPPATITTSNNDAGISAALWGGLTRGVDFNVEFWRSTTFRYNTVTVGITLKLVDLFRKP